MSEPWNFTEAQRRQFREAHADAKRKQMALDMVAGIDDIDEMTTALRSCVKSGALSREDAIGHLRTVYGLSQARAADLIREPE